MNVEATRLDGHRPLPVMRRALVRAWSTFERRAPLFARATEVLTGPRQRPDGTIELKALRAFSGDLTVDRLGAYLDGLATLTLWAQRNHGTRIQWA